MRDTNNSESEHAVKCAPTRSTLLPDTSNLKAQPRKRTLRRTLHKRKARDIAVAQALLIFATSYVQALREIN
jgi:hypothetical protein